MQKIGVTIFGNALEKIPIESWGIDDAAVQKIGQIMGPQVNVRRLAIPGAALKALENPAPFSGWDSNPLEELLRAAAAGSPKCELYVTLTRIGFNYNQTNQTVTGLTIVDTSPLVDRVFLVAGFVIALYDSDLKYLKRDIPGFNLLPGLMAAPQAMHRQVDRTWMPEPPQAAAQSAQLKNATRALVEDGLAKTLPALLKPADEQAVYSAQRD